MPGMLVQRPTAQVRGAAVLITASTWGIFRVLSGLIFKRIFVINSWVKLLARFRNRPGVASVVDGSEILSSL